MVSTYEGFVKNGQIQLGGNVTLPEAAKVYVIIPGQDTVPSPRILSPKLARPEQAADFRKTVIENNSDADL